MPLFSHIDLRVRDLAAATRFYDALLAELGFRRQAYDAFGDDEATWRRPGWAPNDEFFGIVRDAEFRSNANRIAFWCESGAQVDRVAAAARAAGGRDIDGPEMYDGYYAVFFEDPDGNRLEACYLEKHGGLSGDPS